MELDKKEAEAKILQIQEEIQKKTEAHNLELEQLKAKAEQKLIDIKKEEEDFKILMDNKKQEILSE
jgi:3-dehydroquinate dehydratase